MEQREKGLGIQLASIPIEKLTFWETNSLYKLGRWQTNKKGVSEKGDSKNPHHNQDVENKISHEAKGHKRRKI